MMNFCFREKREQIVPGEQVGYNQIEKNKRFLLKKQTEFFPQTHIF